MKGTTIAANSHRLVRAIDRDTITKTGPRRFDVTYCNQCKVFVAHDVTYSPDLDRPALKLRELTPTTGSMPPECHVGPSEAVKRDWGRRQTSLL